ncbi:hypothetical protein L6452_44546 [Arctium lappa]|uniref:Uncharacterized protein n=1 Tax=Arctium lappa TaxID=4217 RepID=A0ACB8XGH4_ARCLA|nr:hypothetical protein L6452_44546 [Arctium lappa]
MSCLLALPQLELHFGMAMGNLRAWKFPFNCLDNWGLGKCITSVIMLLVTSQEFRIEPKSNYNLQLY